MTLDSDTGPVLVVTGGSRDVAAATARPAAGRYRCATLRPLPDRASYVTGTLLDVGGGR